MAERHLRTAARVAPTPIDSGNGDYHKLVRRDMLGQAFSPTPMRPIEKWHHFLFPKFQDLGREHQDIVANTEPFVTAQDEYNMHIATRAAFLLDSSPEEIEMILGHIPELTPEKKGKILGTIEQMRFARNFEISVQNRLIALNCTAEQVQQFDWLEDERKHAIIEQIEQRETTDEPSKRSGHHSRLLNLDLTPEQLAAAKQYKKTSLDNATELLTEVQKVKIPEHGKRKMRVWNSLEGVLYEVSNGKFGTALQQRMYTTAVRNINQFIDFADAERQFRLDVNKAARWGQVFSSFVQALIPTSISELRILLSSWYGIFAAGLVVSTVWLIAGVRFAAIMGLGGSRIRNHQAKVDYLKDERSRLTQDQGYQLGIKMLNRLGIPANMIRNSS